MIHFHAQDQRKPEVLGKGCVAAISETSQLFPEVSYGMGKHIIWFSIPSNVTSTRRRPPAALCQSHSGPVSEVIPDALQEALPTREEPAELDQRPRCSPERHIVTGRG